MIPSHTVAPRPASWRALVLGGGMAGLALAPLAGADDTDIFYGRSTDSFEHNPNILFVLDNSGSMGDTDDGVSGTRMQRLQRAMTTLLDESSNFNVGLMAFQNDHGGAVRYPIGYLEDSTAALCDGACPDEIVVARPGGGADDAVQHDVTGAVSLGTPTLAMTTLDAGGPDPVDGPVQAGSAVATGDVVAPRRPDAASAGDATTDNAALTLFTGTDPALGPTAMAVRFDGVQLPADAVVRAATITFRTDTAGAQRGAVAARIHAEATATPAPYSERADDPAAPPLHLRNVESGRTSASASWNAVPPVRDAAGALQPDWDGSTVVTPDLAPILTEVASLNGWAAGNAVSFILNPTDEYVPSADDARRFFGAGAAVDLRPVLRYEYSSAGDADIETTTVTATALSDEITEQNTGVVRRNLGNATTELFHAGSRHEPRRVALRFDGIDVPPGAILTGARLLVRTAPLGTQDDPADWVPVASTVPETTAGATDTAAGSDGAGDSGPTDEPALGAGSAGVTLHLSAELDPTPAPYDGPTLGERTYGSSFAVWSGIGETPGERHESPQLAAVVDEVIGRADWRAGDSLSLLLNAPDDYVNAASNVRLLRTPAHATDPATHPQLKLTWRRPDATTSEAAVTQTVAVRFNNVHVPPGARIRSAELEFRAARPDDGETRLEISAEDVASSAPFTGTANDLRARARTSTRLPWAPGPWDRVDEAYRSVDIGPVVQAVTDRTDWCGGNPLTIFVEGTGLREAHSADGAAGTLMAPALRIAYEPDSVASESYCSNDAIAISMVDGNDDGVERGGEMRLGDAALQTVAGNGSSQQIGLHFRDVRIPAGARIVSAGIKLHARTDIVDGGAVLVDAHASDDAPAFSSRNGDIGSRAWSPAARWSVSAGPRAGEPVFSDDIAALVQGIVDRPGWERGASMALRLRGESAATELAFSAWDDAPNRAPQLVVYFEADRTDPGQRVREHLKREVQALRPAGWTPIVSSLYEAAQYLTGGPVDYGLQRGSQDWASPTLRVSHPFSYTGGRVERDAGCTDDALDSADCTDEEIVSAGGATPTYVSPMQSACQTNHVVLLSDGLATRNSADEKRIPDLVGLDKCEKDGEDTCGLELARWLHDTDHRADIEGVQNVKLHTVALSLEDEDFLQGLAREGGGLFESAESAADLVGAFKRIFSNTVEKDATFVSVTASVNLENRLKHDDDVYFALFDPKGTARWGGNLKRYRQGAASDGTAEIVDADGDPAIGEDGKFRPGSRSLWSASADGADVLLGGAAAELGRLPNHLARKVVTYAGVDTDLTGHDSNALLPGNAALQREWFDLSPAAFRTDEDFARLLSWTHGADVDDIDGDDDVIEARAQMGDPLHSQPLVVTYADGTDDGAKVVFVATNEGYLHALDAETGRELWAFVPRELLKNLQRFYLNDATRFRTYGLDGGLTTWLSDDDGDGMIEAGETAMLYIGMRRGGNAYYALDIGSRTAPKYAWKLQGGRQTGAAAGAGADSAGDTADPDAPVDPDAPTDPEPGATGGDGDATTADGDYTSLGDTWSRPQKTRVRVGAEVRDVLVFAGGYSANQDPGAAMSTGEATPDEARVATRRRTDLVGNALYIVDAATGRLLWKAGRERAGFEAMRYSVPSEVRTIDIDLDGLADLLFVGDTGGQIWRVDIDQRDDDSPLAERVTGGLFASLAGDAAEDSRRFYYPPDASLIDVDGRQQLSVSIGSGWRANPLGELVENRYYSLRTPHVYGPPLDSLGEVSYAAATIVEGSTGVADVTEDFDPAAADIARGWYIRLEDAGEKVLGASVTADHRLVFTTYVPGATGDLCAAAVGQSYVHLLDVRSGRPAWASLDADGVLTHADRRGPDALSGIAPTPHVLFPESGDATVMIGLEKLHEFDIEPRRRTFWQELVESED